MPPQVPTYPASIQAPRKMPSYLIALATILEYLLPTQLLQVEDVCVCAGHPYGGRISSPVEWKLS